MLCFQNAHGLIGGIVLARRRKRAVVLHRSVVHGAFDGEPVVRRGGVVDVVIHVVRRAVQRNERRARCVRRNAQAGGIALGTDARLRSLAVVDDVHTADLAVIVDVQIVMSARALLGGEVLDVEVGFRRGVCRVRRGGDDLDLAALVTAVDGIARHGVPVGRVDVLRRKVAELPFRPDRAARRGHRRTGEVDAAVRVRLQRVVVLPDGAVIGVRSRVLHVVVELRERIVDADSVEDDLAEVVIGHFPVVVLVQPCLIPGVFIGRFRDRGAHAIDLVVLRRHGRVAVLLVRDVHRVIDVRIGLVRTADGIRRDAARKLGTHLAGRVVGVQRVLHLIDDVHRVSVLDKAIKRRVVRNTEVILHVAAVERGTLEVEVGVVHRARRVADVVGRRIVDAVAVDENSRGVVRRHHQRGNDRLNVVLPCLDVRHLRPHERALDRRAVGVVRRVGLDAVDEVDIVPLLHDEAALRRNRRIRRGPVRQRRERLAARGERSRGSCHRCGSGKYKNFLDKITHELCPQIPAAPCGTSRSNDTIFIIY